LLPSWFHFVRNDDVLADEPKDKKKKVVAVEDDLDREMRIATVGCLRGVKEWTIRSIKETDMLKGSDRFLRKIVVTPSSKRWGVHCM
jgi:hypothetical protein